MMNRDSAVWGLAIIGALMAYLIGAQVPPTEWTYMQWLQFVAAAVATLSGKLATSPLPHSVEGDAKITPSGR